MIGLNANKLGIKNGTQSFFGFKTQGAFNVGVADIASKLLERESLGTFTSTGGDIEWDEFTVGLYTIDKVVEL